MINKPQHTRGFTLIETLLAVLLLSLAIAGPLSIAAKGLQLSLMAKDQVIANFLAQDAIEYVRFVRDSNRLSGGSDWLAGLDGTSNGHTTNASGSQSSCVGGNYCVIDSLQDKVTYCGITIGACASMPLYYDSTSNTYTYTSSGTTQTTIYNRTIQITNPSVGGNANEASVIVTVQWKDVGGVTRSVILRDNLLNWQ